MVRNTNITVAVGNLCNHMEVSYTSKGTAIGSFSIAVNDIEKKDDDYVSTVSFFSVKLFGKIVETLQPYLKKGVKVCVTGKLKQNRWERDGKKFSAIEIRAEQIELLSSVKTDGQKGQNAEQGEDVPPVEDAEGYMPAPDGEKIPF